MSDSVFDALQSTGNIGRDVSAFLTAMGRADTLAHTRQVVGQARILAARFGRDMAGDMTRAAQAAWCHDLAAVVPPQNLLDEIRRWNVRLKLEDRAIPPLLHGPLAAAVARRKLGITSRVVLNAIRYHSTLRAGAGRLEKIVFVADKVALDPASPRHDFLPALKAALDVGLDAMAFAYLDWVIRHEDELGWTIHPNLRAAHAELCANQVAGEEPVAHAR
ncbi:MAG: HD domain-containing protein [Anaerolineae bacterium]|nr:HD domain-containing protein [Anaerolineae bacterium]